MTTLTRVWLFHSYFLDLTQSSNEPHLTYLLKKANALTEWVWSSWDALTGKICSCWLKFIRNGQNLLLFLLSFSKMTCANRKWYNKCNLYNLVGHHNSVIYKYLVKFAWFSIFIWLTRWISNSPQPVIKWPGIVIHY